MKLGLVTYNLAKDWDVPTIIENCIATGFEGVELRTTHAHGVEVTLTRVQRAEVKQRFADSPVVLCGLGSAFEYHALDPAVVRQNIEGTKEYTILAHDVGTPGVKVRPNGVQEQAGVPIPKTLEQIGLALRECATFAADYGVQIRLEVHGPITSHVPHIQTIMEVADHPNLYVCWNSNPGEVEDGSISANFDRLKKWIGLVHMRDLCAPDYPWQELLHLLQGIGYQGFCCAEVQENPDPLRIMRFYSALWKAYTT